MRYCLSCQTVQPCAQECVSTGFDPEAAKHTEGQFKHQGIHLNPDFSPVKVVKDSDGKLTMTAKNNDEKEITVDGIDYILMATGRKPATSGLGLDKVKPGILLSTALHTVYLHTKLPMSYCCWKLH